MPKKIEEALTRQANKHPDWSKEHKNAFIYGTLRNKFGWKPKQEKKS